MKKKVAIIGGKLQGLEAVLLCSACDFESILIDSNPNALAAPLADRFINADVVMEDEDAINAMMEADFVLPANENIELLDTICKICKDKDIKLAFDRNAYELSSSKIKSDNIFAENNIPAPRYYPAGKAPYIIKPSGDSGSKGVTYAETEEEVERFLAKCKDKRKWVIQEFLTGPSYSIEVIGYPGNYRTYETTQIHMDEVYDCNRVTAPVDITNVENQELASIGKKIAEIIGLKGIMDVEVIYSDGGMCVLEIDARLPSQTPLCVCASSGVNYIKELADIMENGCFDTSAVNVISNIPTAYVHYMRRDGKLFSGGEGNMVEAGKLHMEENGKIIWDYDGTPGQDFSGIFVITAASKEQLDTKLNTLYEKLKMLP